MGRQLLDVALTKDRLVPASRSAAAQVKKIGISQWTPKEADLAALEKQATKGTKFIKVEFLLSYDGKTVHDFVQVDQTVTTLAKLDFEKAGKPGVRRAILAKLVANSVAAVQADLDKFNAAHPPPPTPQDQQKLEQQLSPLRVRLRDKQAALQKLQEEIKQLDQQMKPLLDTEKEYEKRWKND